MKKVLFWILAVVITLGASIYQRKTGPTNPKYETVLQGSGGNCCSDFILWEAGGCLPEAAARRVICIACPLWF